jgi:2-hydroxy-6-oxonona-2,4-dienedioate hydrolase
VKSNERKVAATLSATEHNPRQAKMHARRNHHSNRRGRLGVLAVALASLLLLAAPRPGFAAPNHDGSIDGLHAKFTMVNGVRTRYYDYGQGEPMVLIHGGFTAASSTANVFARNIPGLAKHFHVYALDRLACGMTGNPKNQNDLFSYQAQVDFVYHFIETLKLGRVDLVGHSNGGGIAFFLAVQHPEIVRTLTILAAGPEDPARGVTKLIAKIAKCPSQKTYAGLRCRVEALAWTPTAFSNAYWQADEYMAMLPKSVEARKILMARAAQEKKLETGSPAVAGVGEDYAALRQKMWDEARNGALKMPVLLVAGKDDVLDWGASDATAHLTGELGLYDIIGAKNTRVQMDVINDGGHFMYREHPELFNNDLIHFIEFWEHPSAAKAGM